MKALDHLTNCITERFNQKDYERYCQLESLLLYSARGQPYDDIMDSITTFYMDDLNRNNLRVQLQLFKSMFQDDQHRSYSITLDDIISQAKEWNLAQQTLLSEIVKIIKLVLIMPATNATSERSFSCLRRLKTYLRNSMSQARLNNLMILNIHRDKTDSLDLKAVAREFISKSERRLAVFGKIH